MEEKDDVLDNLFDNKNRIADGIQILLFALTM